MHVAADTETQYDISLGATLLDPGLSAEEVFAALAPVFLSESIEKCLFRFKTARHIRKAQGISLKGNVFDLMIADYLLHAIHPADTLKTLCAERGMPECPASMLALESVITGELREKGLWKLYEEVELPLTRVLYDMEREGFAVDRDMLRELSDRFAARIDEMEGEIYSLAGEKFNILSTKQLGVILFEKLGLPPQKKTKSGYSTDAEVLEALEDKHPIVKLVLEYRFLSKLKSTFVDGLLAASQERQGIYQLQPEYHSHRSHILHRAQPAEHTRPHGAGPRDTQGLCGKPGAHTGGRGLFPDRASSPRTHKRGRGAYSRLQLRRGYTYQHCSRGVRR